MEKTIKNYAKVAVIPLTKDDLKYYDIKIGDRVDIVLTKVISDKSNKINLDFTDKEEIDWADLRSKVR